MDRGHVLNLEFPLLGMHDMVSRPALHKDGGQALDLLIIALKTHAGRPRYKGIL